MSRLTHGRLCGFLLLLVLVAPAMQAQDLCRLDKGKMIPLRDPAYRTYQFTMAVEGSAIAGTTPYELHFDTGSWTTSIPGGALDFSKVKVITRDVTTDWGRPADLVEGQLSVKSVDGTVYSIDNYRFYALKTAIGGPYQPDDRTAPSGNGAIMGAFPSPYLYRAEQSFPYLLTQKYAGDRMGFGIVSTCPPPMDLADGWALSDAYLQIGNTREITDHLAWRTDAPNWQNDAAGFYPEAVPGFKVEVGFSDTNERIVTAGNLMSTVDTGAPDLTLRIADTDPQYTATFASHFVADGKWKDWGNANYNSHATTLVDGTVKVSFTDSQGRTQAYQFYVPPDLNESRRSPASLFAGRWSGGVPWPYAEPATPRNRINLGNSIYYFWPVYHWDIQNKRVGIGTAPPPVVTNQTAFPLAAGMRLARGRKYPSASGAHYLVHQPDGNLVVYTQDNRFVWGLNQTRAPYAKTAAIFLLPDGNLVGLDAGNRQLWSVLPAGRDPLSRLNLTANGQLQLVSDAQGVLWTSTSNTIRLVGAESAPASSPARLDAAYPNPFASTVTIPFTLAQPGRVTLTVYDVLGREVAVLAEGEFPSGRSEATWEASGVPNGVYLYRLRTPGFTQVKTVTRAQ